MAKINSVKPILPHRSTTNDDLLLFNKRTPPMKVTVKFGSTSVVVPVSNGMLVSDLIQASVHRYKKVANKPIDTWVDVKHLQSSTGGILYADDPLIHVVDDKEQIVAIFDEQDAPIHHSYIFPHNIDGGSAGTTSNSPDFVRSSSTNSSAGSNGTGSGGGGGGGIGGTGSGRNYVRNFNHAPCPPVVRPRYFHKDRKSTDSTDHDDGGGGGGINKTTAEHYSKRNLNINRPQDASNSVVVKRLDDIPTSTSLLVVRRGSEPALNGPIDDFDDDENGNIQKINGVNDTSSSTSAITTKNKIKWPTHPDLASEGRSSTDTEEDSSRRVYANDTSTGMGKFVRSGGARKSQVTQEMFEMAVQLAEEREIQRHAAHDKDDADVDVSFSAGQEKHKRFEIHRIIVKSKNDRKPLGIQVLPEYDSDGQLNCLIVQHIQPGTFFADDCQLQTNDRIVDVNDHSISEMSFVGAQTFLHNASNQGHLSLKIERLRPETSSTPVDIVKTYKSENDESSLTNESGGGSTNGTNQSAATLLSNLQKANTRKIGKVLTVETIKGPDGLGFTLTSRDNAAIGDNFTCIKNILPRGSAIKDGRLREGDRILEINNVEVTGMAKDKIVSMLRDVKEGDVVKLVVSRQENVGSLSPVLPRQLPLDKANVDSLGSERYKQRLVFEIPLNDSGSAGLGVSVKGRTANDPSVSREHQVDCGIFIKTIMHGGAAHKDGRLKMNDQLIAVNEIDLTNLSNKEAMNRLRTAMQELDPSASCIKLIVLRPIPSSSVAFDAGASSTLRPMTPPMSPSTPDGGASLLLEMPGSYSPASLKNDVTRRPLHYLVPGYGDYAIVVKDAPTLSVGSRAEERVVIEDDEMRICTRQVSSDVPDTKSETSGVEETDYYQSVNDPFVRDAPNRQSMSEKRHGGGKIDPAHTLTFQKIKHTRQTSAPSLQEPPQNSSTPIRYKVDPSLMDYSTNASSLLTTERRSLSLESLGPSTLAAAQQHQLHLQYYPTTSIDRPLIHEKIAQNVLRNSNLHGPPSKVKSKSKLSAAQRARMTNESFRAAVDKSYDENGLEVAVDVGLDGAESPLDSPIDAPQNGLSSGPRKNIVNKDQRRRKSTGNGLSTLKSLFRFGSGGKSSKQLGMAYEEKRFEQQQKYEAELQEKARRHAEEEQRKIRAHYDRLKEQEQHRQHSPQRQRGVSPNRQQRVLIHPSSLSPRAQQHFINAAHPKMPSHWKPPVPPQPPSPLSYTPPLQTHHSSHQMQLRYHSPSDPTQLSSGTNYHRANDQSFSVKNYDTDDGYGDLNVAIVETNRCYRSLERPSAQSVATAGVQRSTVVQSYGKPSGKDIGTNNHGQHNRRLIMPTHQPHPSYEHSAGDEWPNFDRPPRFIGNNHYQPQLNNGNNNSNVQYLTKLNRDQYKINSSSTSSTTVTIGEQMPPIPPPDYDQYLRTSKPKVARKPRPASDYIGNMNHKTTSLPRRPAKHQAQQYVSREPEKSIENNIPMSYDSYGSLPRNGHYTTVRM